LSVKPGITDEASLKYIDESDILARSENPEWTYINEVMPEKLKINLQYIKNQNLLYDLKIIFWTAKKMFFRD
jgi:lipopolysaccharide/colanic/teichoic acid biosynthesis glycosyltransferase